MEPFKELSASEVARATEMNGTWRDGTWRDGDEWDVEGQQ